MSIEKMSLVTLRGDRQYLDEVLLRCQSSGVFHPEAASSLSEYASGLKAMKEENPYAALGAHIAKLASGTDIDLRYAEYDDLGMDSNQLEAYVDGLDQKISKLLARKGATEEIIASHRTAITQLQHLARLNIKFDELFACRFLKVRFGRLPVDSYKKLSYHSDRPFIIFSYDNDGRYHWCLYLCAAADEEEIDGLFSSLYFRRFHIPDYAHGTPEEALEMIRADLDKEEKELREIGAQLSAIVDQEGLRLRKAYAKVRFLEGAFDLRKYAAYVKNDFVVIGFVPRKEADTFGKRFESLSGQVALTLREPESEPRLTTPVRLRNNVFLRPFEMFVTMYGLPSYRDIDPTPFVGITYILLFGLMFGDLGQGAVICLLGLFLYRKKGMPLGGVMSRIGLSSMVFGFLYGSVFGYEDLLIPVHQALFGRDHLIEVMAPATTNTILLAAVGLGAVIIVAAIAMNIALGIKQRSLDRAILSNNGLAGLVFYLSVLAAAVASFALGRSLLSPLFIGLCIALPLLAVFFREPLSRLAEGRHPLFPEGLGGFLVENFFEMFEVLLSFITNTMSFLRVGGFILSHTGMMAVVMTLAGMVNGGASPLVVVIGNLFVMAMEGLIVGIQVLRLEFYEIFSRFFEGDGRPFEPALVDFSAAPPV